MADSVGAMAGSGPLAGFPTANWVVRGTLVQAGYPGASDRYLGMAMRSAVLDAMLELVGMASGGIATGEASPSMRLTPTSSPSRQVSVIAAA